MGFKYNPHRSRNIYDPKSDKPFKISRSKTPSHIPADARSITAFQSFSLSGTGADGLASLVFAFRNGATKEPRIKVIATAIIIRQNSSISRLYPIEADIKTKYKLSPHLVMAPVA